eukprot:3111396-Prymnesium_polylepis.1
MAVARVPKRSCTPCFSHAASSASRTVPCREAGQRTVGRGTAHGWGGTAHGWVRGGARLGRKGGAQLRPKGRLHGGGAAAVHSRPCKGGRTAEL